MYFSIYNQYFRHHPHKVIFCASQFDNDAQTWWELGTRELGCNTNGDQLYLTYIDFKNEVKHRFWKDSDAQIKHAQWEKPRQASYMDGDLFFQKFEELAFEARVCNNEQMMYAQIRKAARETSKNTIFASDGIVPTTYQGWKDHLLHMDYNYCLKKAENPTISRTGDAKSQMPKAAMPQRGGQTQTGAPERKTGTGDEPPGSVCSQFADFPCSLMLPSLRWSFSKPIIPHMAIPLSPYSNHSSCALLSIPSRYAS